MNSLINDPKLYEILLQIDKDLAAQTKEKGCPHCGGVLHSACYPRKLKGASVSTDNKKLTRFSFCCDTDGCRIRITPHSVRFLGRKRYLSVSVILLSAIHQGLSQRRTEEMSKLLGISLKTLSRWQTWWQDTFSHSKCWLYRKSFIVPPVNPTYLCRELVERFCAQYDSAGMVELLWFISPLNCRSSILEMHTI
jgi:hypothetical protein